MDKLKEKILKDKGITLIALIITIIVLLILAGVTLSVLTGENGTMKRAISAKEENEIAEEKEGLKLSVTHAMMKNATDNGEMKVYTDDKQDLESEIKKYKDETEVNLFEEQGYIFEVVFKSGRIYYINPNGKISEPYTSKLEGKSNILQQDDAGTYLIYKIEDLVELSNRVNSGDSNISLASVKLENDLDFENPDSYYNSSRTDFGDLNKDGTTKTLIEELTEKTDAKDEGFIPIGYNAGLSVIHEFDGQNNKISNMYIKSSRYKNIGLFGAVDNINNLTLSGNIYVTDDNIEEGQYIGGISGNIQSMCENCINEVNINVDKKKSGNVTYIGGIAGNLGGLYNVTNSGNITAKNITGSYVGGIASLVGTAANMITTGVNNGEITVTGNQNYVGGIAGSAGGDGSSSDLKNNGKIIVIGDSNYIAGIYSLIMSGIFESYNNAEIYITGDSNICGGIIGDEGFGTNINEIRSLNNNADIHIESNVSTQNQVGGIFGKFTGGMFTAENITNDGKIVDKGNNTYGGIAGFILSGCTFSNTVNSNGQNCVGQVDEAGRDGIYHYYSTETGFCEFCGEECIHEFSVQAGTNMHFCMKCGLTGEHSWDSYTGCCTICAIECQHQWDGMGNCMNCGMICSHSDTYEQDGITYCSICNAQLQY